MSKNEYILIKAKELEEEWNDLKGMVITMCNDLDREEDLEKKEVIRMAILGALGDIDKIEAKHQDLLSKLGE